MAPWTWVRPADPSVLDGRPLLDLGTGDGQTLAAIAAPRGLVVGMDRSAAALRAAGPLFARLVAADAAALPFRSKAFAVVMAGDLLHHLDDGALDQVLLEIRRILLPKGTFIAWWYESEGRQGPGAPSYSRRYESVASAARGFSSVEPLPLKLSLEPAPATVGLMARS